MPSTSGGVAVLEARFVGGVRRKKQSRRPIFQHRGEKTRSPGKAKKAASSPRNLSPSSVLYPPQQVSSGLDDVYLSKEDDDDTSLDAVTEEQPKAAVSLGAPAAEPLVQVPTAAWILHERLLDLVKQRQDRLTVLNGQVIGFTATTMACAVFYAHSFGGYPAWNDSAALALFVASAALPLFVVYLIQKRASFVRTTQKSVKVHRQAAVQLESELYQWRTCVGAYTDLEGAASREHFESQVRKLWIKAESRASVFQPEPLADDFWDTFWTEPETETHAQESKTPVPLSSFKSRGTVALYTPDLGGYNTMPPRNKEHDDEEATDHDHLAELPSLPRRPSKQPDRPTLAMPPIEPLQLAGDMQHATETTPMLARRPETTEEPTLTVDTAKDEPPEKIKQDDGHSLLTMDEYLEFRVKRVLQETVDDIAKCESRHTLIQRCILVLTLGATATALFSMQWIIPLLLALAAAGSSLLEVGAFGSRVPKLQELQGVLETVVTSWEERNVEAPPEAADLVLQAEQAIMAAAVA